MCRRYFTAVTIPKISKGLCTRLPATKAYAAAFAAARISSSFLTASFVHSFAFRRRNSRSSLSFVRAAYHSHCRACSKHSSMVGDMDASDHDPVLDPCFDRIPRTLRLWLRPKLRCAKTEETPRAYCRVSPYSTRRKPVMRGSSRLSSHQRCNKAHIPLVVPSGPAGGNGIGSPRVI